MRTKLLKALVISGLVIASFASRGPIAQAADNKLELSSGGYALSATTAKRSGSLAGLGIYRIGYSYGFGNQFEFQLGYTLFMSDIITGDLGFGPDLGVLYYPVTDTGIRNIVTENVQLSVEDVVRPFVSLGFHQRQFQSVESSYAGFSVGAGAEYGWSQDFSLKGQVRYLLLNGPSNATANQLDLLFGITFSL
jgi:opacity protein-like surface antigen